MSQHRYEQMLIERDHLKHPWEKSFSHGYEITDLDQKEIYQTVEQAVRFNRLSSSARHDNIRDILINFELMKEDKLLNAAVVLFAKKTTGFYLQCGLRLARFRGKDMLGDFIDNQQIEGHAFFLVEEAEAFFKRHIPISSTFHSDKFERIDTSALPLLALREALINAVCHRDYGYDTPSVSVAIFDDRVEIWNPGFLPKGLVLDDLKLPHISKPRNKIIADIFYKRNFIEKWGTGTLKMINLCKEQGIECPEFNEYMGGFSIVFRFKESIGPSHKQENQKSLDSISQRQKLALQFSLENEGITIHQYQNLFPEVPRRTLQRELQDLLKQEFIERTGSTHKLVYKIRKK
ncbi:MAG TPA: ATP-binding protein [Alphaproteobacteria bacterium]|nr:ATP-binding protein [Alphaproteobacteria bacterium]HQS94408.1 ATP-binding protein [Alphaproteobacteria bacterium]